jgi:putative RecB family exonuclease
MALPLPSSLSPSKVSSFKDCALAFRFSTIDKLPEPPSPHTLKGTLVHRALERLFTHHDRGERSAEAAANELELAWEEVQDEEDVAALELPAAELVSLREDAAGLVRNYFRLEDPDLVDHEGVELTLEAELDGLVLRGIIDRLDRTPNGEFEVVDYKTGRIPSETHEQSRLAGVHFYAVLCEQALGRRPERVKLLYLRGPVTIEAQPTDQSVRGLRLRAGAVWSAIERACETEDFRPRPSSLCGWCHFRSLCPVYGGDPAAALEMAGAVRNAVPG